MTLSICEENLLHFCSILNHVPPVPAPIKDAASIQKLFFLPHTMVRFAKFHLCITIHDCTKFSTNKPIFGNVFGAATFQERPLFARVR